jgi:hypothetical protein
MINRQDKYDVVKKKERAIKKEGKGGRTAEKETDWNSEKREGWKGEVNGKKEDRTYQSRKTNN